MTIINTVFGKTHLVKTLALGAVISSMSLLLQAQTINLSYNGAANADKNAVHLFAKNLQTLVEKKTHGDLKLKLYPNSMLGKEEERMEQVLNTPSLNIASFGGISPLFPEIFVSSIPFLFNNFDQARQFFDHGNYWKQAKKAFYKRTGGHLLAVVEEGGFLAFTNNKRPIKSPKDFKGLRFRAMDKSQVALYNAFGASGTPIPWTEVYLALKTGVANGQMNPPMYIILGSLFEVQKYATLANIQYSDQFLVGNDELLKSLSKKDKAALLDAIKEANDINRKAVQSQVQSRISYMEKKGMQVYRPTAEELEEFRSVGQPSYLNWLKEEGIDQKWVDLALKDVNFKK